MAHMTTKLVLVLSLILMISVSTQSVKLFPTRKVQDSASLSCDSVHGAKSGETCSSVAKEFGLSLNEFLVINPNINCTAVFVGQWLCVAASV